MNKSSELELNMRGIVVEENCNDNKGEVKMETARYPELSRPSSRIGSCHSDKLGNCDENGEKVNKFTMIFNKYNSRMNMVPFGKSNNDGKCKEKYGSMYTMIFNKDVIIRAKSNPLKPPSKNDMKKGEQVEKSGMNQGKLSVSQSQLSSMKLNDAETLMNIYGRSNLFIPDLTIYDLTTESSKTSKNSCCEKHMEDAVSEKLKNNGAGLRLYNSLTSLSKSKENKKADDMLKNKIASLTSLDTHLTREIPRKHISVMQERKLYRVRSLDLSESTSLNGSDIEKPLGFQKYSYDENQVEKESENKRSDKKSRGDSLRKAEKDNGCRKQVQWKSEVDVIYFESHQAADGDRSGEILGRVIEPLREEWEQRTGFYAKLSQIHLTVSVLRKCLLKKKIKTDKLTYTKIYNNVEATITRSTLSLMIRATVQIGCTELLNRS